ncbi:MAG: TolC family protein [Candidatus Sulfobium sp.]|jgi:outer membrane protein TolC
MPERLRESAARLVGMICCSLLTVSLAGTVNMAWAGNRPGGRPPLPDPLTLTEALSYADAPNPGLDLVRADLGSALAGVLEAASNTGLRSYLYITPQWVDSSTDFSGGMVDDSSAQLILTKRLYDFGQTRALTDSAKAAVSAQRRLYFDARQERRLEIIKRFFDVLLADARYAFDSEETAYNYVSFDKARYRHRLGRISDVDLLAYEDRYRQALVRRTRSQAAQRLTRAQLAVALNHPGDLPENLVRPDLPQLDRPVPDYRKVLQMAFEANPVVLSLRDQVRSATEKLAAAERLSRPFLEGELEAAVWKREFNGRNDARATLNLYVPIYQGGVVRASVARARAEILRAEARLENARQELSTTLLDLVEQVNSLKVARKAARVRSAYRELYADRSRSMYNLEIRTDLGDAMARLTEAQWQAAKVDYELALTWARIDALTGRIIAASPEKTIR